MNSPTPTPQKNLFNRKTAALAVLLLFAFLLGAGAAFLVGRAVRGTAPAAETEAQALADSTAAPSEQNPSAETDGGKQNLPAGLPVSATDSSDGQRRTLTASEIYEENLPSIVGITAKGTTSNIFGQTVTSASSGTGFVIREDGYILTNCHVIENSTEFTVSFANGDTYPAEVVGYENELSDLAVLKIEATGLRAVTVGNSDALSVGEDIVIVGNPLGELTFSLSKGVVSALDREINTDGNPITMFQIDAAVNHGNSGGPAFNSAGEIVGIVTAKYASEEIEGLGFCLPASDASAIASDLISYGYLRGRASLGLSGEDEAEIYRYYSRFYGNRVDQLGLLSEGVYVASVTEKGPAATAGIVRGDVITEINGKKVADCAALKSALASLSPGEEVTLTLFRDGVYRTVSPVLAEYNPTLPESAATGGDAL